MSMIQRLLSCLAALLCTGLTLAQNDGYFDDAAYLDIKTHSPVLSPDCFGYAEALQFLELDKVLKGSGPFTLFIPQAEQFDEISANAPKKESLYALCTYHIVAGKITASKILQMINRGNGKALFTTVEGGKLQAELRGLDIVLTDSLGNRAIITKADQNLDYGVTHNIDKVLMPRSLK